MSLRIVLFSALILFVFPGVALPFEGYVQSYSQNATLSWGTGEIVVPRVLATQIGGDSSLSPLAVRKATSSARKQLLDIIMSVRIDAKRTVSAYLSEDADLAARVRGAVQNSPLERPNVFGEEGEVRVSEHFRGKLAELVLPTTIQFQSGIPPKLSTSMEQSMGYQGAVPEKAGSGSSYTGVIIDARGMKVTPALVPVVYGQDGVGAYGAFQVSRANAVEKGVVAYATAADPALLRERVGANPLTVRAVSAYGSWRTDILITTPMANLVRAIMRTPELSEKCSVVVVISVPEDERDKVEEAGGVGSVQADLPAKDQ
ncbi:hypothetical protein [Pseudodesulfovibrio sp. zrk46]|uniref:hypothetical protein n=1 Tax=Pseudodesulfovibrio sp. zrk46 TaxID=2725288 RepID=UPI0014496DCB|nr:hypothetical protein [Pseudodesulfovibrio sp. zrk46]QJB57857.1 hypothetical protein HFN16_16260 [Pseudodesulfovibrio sp. zrk46]